MVDENADESLHPVDVLAISDLGAQLKALADQLSAVSKHTERENFRAVEKAWEIVGDEDDAARLEEAYAAAVRQTLMGLAEFRRSYDYWERLIAEYALKQGFTQRQAAGYLGVAVSTINRWAQHPLTSDRQN